MPSGDRNTHTTASFKATQSIPDTKYSGPMETQFVTNLSCLADSVRDGYTPGDGKSVESYVSQK